RAPRARPPTARAHPDPRARTPRGTVVRTATGQVRRRGSRSRLSGGSKSQLLESGTGRRRERSLGVEDRIFVCDRANVGAHLEQPIQKLQLRIEQDAVMQVEETPVFDLAP